MKTVHPYVTLGLGCGIVYDLLADDSARWERGSFPGGCG